MSLDVDCQVVGLDDVRSLLEWSPLCLGGLPRPPPACERGRPFLGAAANDLSLLRPLEVAPPRTLLCHDLKGGYLQDRFSLGCPSMASPPYVFTHWALVDSLVYFSHHFVSPPPRGWIVAGHRNGVKVAKLFCICYSRLWIIETYGKQEKCPDSPKPVN